MTGSRTRVLVETALCVALAVVLGFVKLIELPNGGAVSLEMLPIMVLGLRRGVRVGIAAGGAYGLLSLLLGAYVVHPAQFLLDYPLAYALVGAAGLWWRAAGSARGVARWGALVGGPALGALLRFCAHWVSGVIFFASMAPAGQSAWLYSLIYNASYMVPAALICVAAAAGIVPALARAVPER